MLIRPKLIPTEQLEKEYRTRDEEAIKTSRMDDVASASRNAQLAVAGRGEKLSDAASRTADVAAAHRSAKLSQLERQDQKMEKALRQLEKWQPPKIATARESRGRRQSKGTAYGGAAHSGFEQGMQKRVLYKAFGIQTRPQNLTSSLPLYKMDMAIDLYDGVLQKADMNWDNVPEEDLVRLEKILGLRNPFKGEKSDKEKTEKTGLDASAVSNGKPKKEAPSVGFFNKPISQEEAQKQGRQKRSEGVDAAMKDVKESRAEKLAGAIGRFGSKVQGKVDQRQNIGTAVGRAKDAAIAGGKELATQTRAKTVATATEARRRGSAAADVLATGKTRNIKPTFSDTKMGRDQARLEAPTVPNRVKQRHASLGQNVPSLHAIPESGEAPGKQVTRGSAYKAPKSADPAAASRRAMAGGLSMSKAMISLQKISEG